jgi:hypothetical protein
VEHPQFPFGFEGVGWVAGLWKEAVAPLVDVADGPGHRATHKLAGARRPALFEPVDEHLHHEPRLDRWQHVAGAPPRRQAAPRAAGGTGENDAAGHDKSSGIQRGGSMIVAVVRLSDSHLRARQRMAEIQPGRYRHYKGNEYTVLGVARHSETLEELVVYRQEYGERGLWVRPAAMFAETVEVEGETVPRFRLLSAE